MSERLTNSLTQDAKRPVPPSNRNVIINGAMQIAQRGTSPVASITTNGYYTADRFNLTLATLGTWTQSVETDAPTGSGLIKSLKMLCTTADASPAAGDALFVTTALEGQNLQQFLKGTASAKPFTLSFWVKSNVTGTYIVGFFDDDNARMNSQSYTISVSGTWEKKTITFPADTTGAFDNDNNGSLNIGFWLAAGSNYTSGTLATTWQTNTTANRAVGQTNVAAATSNYWQVTGVQLEVGAVATPFEFEDFSTTLAKCQRYYNVFVSGSGLNFAVGYYFSTTQVEAIVFLPVTMRTSPTLVASSGTDYYCIQQVATNDFFNALITAGAHPNGAMIYSNALVSGTAGTSGRMSTQHASSSIAFSAEL